VTLRLIDLSTLTMETHREPLTRGLSGLSHCTPGTRTDVDLACDQAAPPTSRIVCLRCLRHVRSM